jgi:hypothetical protein
MAHHDGPVTYLKCPFQFQHQLAQNSGFGQQPVTGKGKSLEFFHGGRNAGFDAFLVGYPETGKGAIIMINANANPKALNSISKAIVVIPN